MCGSRLLRIDPHQETATVEAEAQSVQDFKLGEVEDTIFDMYLGSVLCACLQLGAGRGAAVHAQRILVAQHQPRDHWHGLQCECSLAFPSPSSCREMQHAIYLEAMHSMLLLHACNPVAQA